MFLKDGHFTTIDPTVPVPRHWLSFDPKEIGPVLSFLGGGKSRGSTQSKTITNKSRRGSQGSAPSQSSLSSWLNPLSARSVPAASHTTGSQADALSEWLAPAISSAGSKPNKTPGPNIGADDFSDWLAPASMSVGPNFQHSCPAGSSSGQSDAFQSNKTDSTKRKRSIFTVGKVSKNTSFSISAKRNQSKPPSGFCQDVSCKPPVFKKGRPPSKVLNRLVGKQADPRRG